MASRLELPSRGSANLISIANPQPTCRLSKKSKTIRRYEYIYSMKGFLILALTISSLANFSQSTGETFLKEIHQRFFRGPCPCYTFSQKNTHYRNDSIIGNSVWHEAVQFPDKFRINFGGKTDSNFVVFKNDSVFRYRKGRFVKSRRDSNTLLLLLGGMFYREWNDVKKRVNDAGYNLSVSSEQTWQGKEVFVIGAKAGDETSNQFWIDKKTGRGLRIIEKNGPDIMDMRFEEHRDWCKGYVETRVSFRRNGKLEQVEQYYDIAPCNTFPE